MTANIKVLIIILSIPYAKSEMYSLFTVNSRFSGFLLEKMSPMGMEMCVKECAKRVSCASLNFHRGRLECELSHSDATANPEGMTSNSEYIYIDRSHIPQVYCENYFFKDNCSESKSFKYIYIRYSISISFLKKLHCFIGSIISSYITYIS